MLSAPLVFDFDEIEGWRAALEDALADHVDAGVLSWLGTQSPEFINDSYDLLMSCVDVQATLASASEWLRSVTYRAYHGTRLFEDELANVRRNGLLRSSANARRARLERLLRTRDDWPEVSARLDTDFQSFLTRQMAKHRLGQVHLTLSRAGLLNGFDHYLQRGSEFDQRFLQHYCDDRALQELAGKTLPYLITVEVPGAIAFQAIHRYQDLAPSGEPPTLVRKVLQHWSYARCHAGFVPASQEEDIGIALYDQDVPPDWIKSIEPAAGKGIGCTEIPLKNRVRCGLY